MNSEALWPTTWYRLGGGDGECALYKPEMWDNQTTIVVWLNMYDGEEKEAEYEF